MTIAELCERIQSDEEFGRKCLELLAQADLDFTIPHTLKDETGNYLGCFGGFGEISPESILKAAEFALNGREAKDKDYFDFFYKNDFHTVQFISKAGCWVANRKRKENWL